MTDRHSVLEWVSGPPTKRGRVGPLLVYLQPSHFCVAFGESALLSFDTGDGIDTGPPGCDKWKRAPIAVTSSSAVWIEAALQDALLAANRRAAVFVPRCVHPPSLDERVGWIESGPVDAR